MVFAEATTVVPLIGSDAYHSRRLEEPEKRRSPGCSPDGAADRQLARPCDRTYLSVGMETGCTHTHDQPGLAAPG